MAPDWREMGDKKLDVGRSWDREAGVGDQDGNQELRWGRSEARSSRGQDLERGGIRVRLGGRGWIGNRVQAWGQSDEGRPTRGLVGRRRSQGGAAVSRDPRLRQGPRGAAARGHGRGHGVANSHEDVVDEGPAAGSLQHVVDPVLQAAVALVRG